MKKFVSFLFVLSLLLSAKAFSQTWKYDGTPDTALKGNTHAIAVDPEGKVWFGSYYNDDSIKTGPTTYGKVKDIHVFNANGTQASFSPIQVLTVNGVADTLWNSSRGARADNEGNILWASFETIYKVNYKTGEGMNKFEINSDGHGITAPSVDAAGNIYCRNVFPNYPVYLINPDFTSGGNAIDTVGGYSRTILVSSDGNTIYQAGYTLNSIVVYHRASEFDPYTVSDTILKGFQCESIAWNPKTGYLWASAGNVDFPPNQYPGASTSYSVNTWYAYDVNSKTIVDSLHWYYQNIADSTAATDPRPRAIAFSPTGDTAYVGCFNSPNAYMVERFVHTVTAVRMTDNNVVKSFELSQNYPNPFNPTTEISFSVAKAGMVTLKVYDILGREVATLVNENMSNGKYSISFDASKLSSGTYIYQLNANGVQISKKMMLLK